MTACMRAKPSSKTVGIVWRDLLPNNGSCLSFPHVRCQSLGPNNRTWKLPPGLPVPLLEGERSWEWTDRKMEHLARPISPHGGRDRNPIGRGYLPAKDDPDMDRDAVVESNQDSERRGPSDAMKKRDDARGQYAPSQADRTSTGIASAKPTVITGSEDVTGDRFRSCQKGKDWDRNVDETQPDRSK